MKKIITLLFISSLLIMNNKQTHAQVTIEDINFQLRDMYKNLKRPPDSIPFLFDMSSHVIEDKLYRSVNDSDYITKGMFLTMYEEMRSAAFDTSIMEPADSIELRMRKRSRNDTVNISILNADYATFLDDAFDIDGQYYYLTDTTVDDVTNRSIEPFLLKNVFVSSLTTPISYFRKVNFRIDSAFIFTNENLLGISNRDLDPNYARWKIDFGEGAGWREFNPKETKHFSIMYPDTGMYEVNISVFYCDPYPMCNTYASKLSKTSIYILNNSVPKDPDLTYEFSNITVGLYKGCGETKGGVYIPLKPLIIVEGIDLLNTRSIPVLYNENVHIESSKKLGLLSEYNYDFYIVNFNNTHLDMRDNAKGIVELLDYLKSIMPTNEQFVVFAESMGGIIARYALTYMESDLYTQNPNSHEPTQMHNTRLYISNDAPHQGANVPLSIQALYRNIQNSTVYKVVKKVKYILPILNEEKYWNDLLNSKSVQQLLAYHIDANGPHQSRVDFMNDLISLNPQTNGYPAFTKMMAFTDGLLSGQSQLKINNNILKPGDSLFSVDLNIKLKLTSILTIPLLDYKLILNTVNKDDTSNPIIISNYTYATLRLNGCLIKFLRKGYAGVISCAVKHINTIKNVPQPPISSNFDTEAAGIFSILSILSSQISVHNISISSFDINTILDKNTGELKFSAITSSLISDPKKKGWKVNARLKLASHGFGFIPVHSAIDFDYYKTLNISSDYNLVKEDIQGFLFAHTPFHVISGFNYTGLNYPSEGKVELNNMNWSHGYFTNTAITDGTNENYLSLEIGSQKIYLNNLNIGTRSADYKFSEVNIGVQNPYFIYDLANIDEHAIKYVYSKLNNFEFKEPSIVNVYYGDNVQQGVFLNNEGSFNKIKIAIKPCKVSHKKEITTDKQSSQVIITPNPFQEEIIIENLLIDSEYSIKIHNLLGQEVFSEQVFSIENNRTINLNTTDIPNHSMYIISIFQKNQLIIKQKLIKI